MITQKLIYSLYGMLVAKWYELRSLNDQRTKLDNFQDCFQRDIRFASQELPIPTSPYFNIIFIALLIAFNLFKVVLHFLTS